MRDLDGIGVLVTRPEAQAAELTRSLATAGAQVFHLPTLATQPCAGRAQLRASLGPVDRYRWIIFMSANAVRHGASLLGTGVHATNLCAVGPATAAALSAAGHRVALVPEAGFTSEQLLATDALQAVRGQRILVVRGVEGRDLIVDVLRGRGAEVTLAEVYERVRAVPPPGAVPAVEQALAERRIHVVTATSGDVLRCLIELLSPAGNGLLGETPLLVGGERIAAAARAMGLRGELILANSPESSALLTALRRFGRQRLLGR